LFISLIKLFILIRGCHFSDSVHAREAQNGDQGRCCEPLVCTEVSKTDCASTLYTVHAIPGYGILLIKDVAEHGGFCREKDMGPSRPPGFLNRAPGAKVSALAFCTSNLHSEKSLGDQQTLCACRLDLVVHKKPKKYHVFGAEGGPTFWSQAEMQVRRNRDKQTAVTNHSNVK
jgi:hypothetical protein